MGDVISLSAPTSSGSDPTLAPWANIRLGAVESWVEVPTGEVVVEARSGDHSTLLLWSVQHHLERNLTFRASASRFETAVSVQHGAQWSIELAPAYERLTLHWLRVRRGAETIDQLQRERMRLLQRETQLERLVIDGSWTLLLVLEDVRPGDVLEVGYTIETQDQIRPGSREALLFVPPGQQVGRYQMVVLSDPARPLPTWKAAADLGAVQEGMNPAGLRRWAWEGAQVKPRRYDISQGMGWLDFLWLQVTDLADWAPLTKAVAEVWARRTPTVGLTLDPAFAKPATVDGTAIVRLIQHLQDDYRYLSLDLNTCGWIPTEPGEVARRRYGDCKDLAWLASTVLRSWGVTARPVLVSSYLRGRVAHLLPSARLFNHAIVEVAHGGVVRWFDLTDRMRGGDFQTLGLGWFGRGLVIGPGVACLGEQPKPGKIGRYHLRETFLIDTKPGQSSMLELRLRVEGPQADGLRRRREELGHEPFAEGRAEVIVHRYGKSKRNLPLVWRDDRDANVCELVESYELEAFVHPTTNPTQGLCSFSTNIVSELLPVPAELDRQLPWYLPGPIEVVHEVVARSTAILPQKPVRRKWVHPELEGRLDVTFTRHAAQSACELHIPAPEVAAERVAVVRQCALEVQKLAVWRLLLQRGHARHRRFVGFGLLDPATDIPAAVSGRERPVAADVSGLAAAVATPPPPAPDLFRAVPTRGRRRSGGGTADAKAAATAPRESRSGFKRYRWLLLGIVLLLGLLGGMLFAIYRVLSGG